MVKNNYGSYELGARLNNQLNGRCIKVHGNGDIYIESKKDGKDVVGNLVRIYSDGDISVGEWYRDGNGFLADRGTTHKTDGTTSKYGD